MDKKCTKNALKSTKFAKNCVYMVHECPFSDKRGTKLTKTVFTEILYFLSPTKKVSESIKIFGIDEKITDLIVVTFQDQVQDLIEGDLADLSQLNQVTNWEKIAKMHGIKPDMDRDKISDLVISKTSCKDFLM